MGIFGTEFRITSASEIDSKFISEPAFTFGNLWSNESELAALQISYAGGSTEVTQEKGGGGPNDVNQIKLHTNTRDNTTRLPLVLNEAKEVAGPVVVPDMLTVGKDLTANGGLTVRSAFRYDDQSNLAEGSFLKLGADGLAHWENPSNLGFDQGVANHLATFDQNGKLKASAFSITQELATLELGIQSQNDNYLKHTINGKDFEERTILTGPKKSYKKTFTQANNEHIEVIDFNDKFVSRQFNTTKLSTTYLEPQLQWSGKVADYHGAINPEAIVFEKRMESLDENGNVIGSSRLDMWKIKPESNNKILNFDFNTSESNTLRDNKTLFSLQYHDDTRRNIGFMSRQSLQTPNIYVGDWGLIPGLRSGSSVSLVNIEDGGLLSLPMTSQRRFSPVDFYSYRLDNVVAEFHGNVIADNFSKADPSSVTGTSAIGNLLLEDFNYHTGPCVDGAPSGTEIKTPRKTLFARETMESPYPKPHTDPLKNYEDHLYRLVLGKNIPKIGTGWVSCIDLNNSFDANPTVKSLGNLTTLESNYLLSVDGLAVFKSLLVMNPQAYRQWPDFVFEPSYKLASLDTVEAYIKKEKHLPGIPSAKEIDAKGIDVAQMASANTQKIEELFLYVIELKKQNEQLRAELQTLKSALK